MTSYNTNENYPLSELTDGKLIGFLTDISEAAQQVDADNYYADSAARGITVLRDALRGSTVSSKSLRKAARAVERCDVGDARDVVACALGVASSPHRAQTRLDNVVTYAKMVGVPTEEISTLFDRWRQCDPPPTVTVVEEEEQPHDVWEPYENPRPSLAAPARFDAESATAKEEFTLLRRRLVTNFEADTHSAIIGLLDDADTLDSLARFVDTSAFESLFLRLGSLAAAQRAKGDFKRVEATVRRRKKEQTTVESDEIGPTVEAVLDVLPDAPVTLGMVVPDGWTLRDEGIRNSRGHLITPCPIVIVGRFIGTSGQESLHLSLRRERKWKAMTADRLICCSRAILTLSSNGFPVNEANYRDVIKYLSAYEAANLVALPVAKTTHHLGWYDDDTFVTGSDIITKSTPFGAGASNLNVSWGWMPDAIVFRGEPGAAQLGRGFSQHGSLDDWIESVQKLGQFPTVALGVYAALVPVLLRKLKLPGFAIEWAGETSTGKTATLRIAGSVWGQSDEGSEHSVVKSWDATPVFIERAATMLHSLPLMLDDTKKARSREAVTSALYTLANSQGRGRGTPDGVRTSGHWRTCLLSTGEEPASAMTEAGGARARVLTLWGPPFGETSGDTAQLIHSTMASIRDHNGVAGPAFVQGVLDEDMDWWRGFYAEKREMYEDRAGDNRVASRLAGPVAAIEIAGRLAGEILGLDWDTRALLDELWRRVVSEGSDSDRPEAALRWVASWAVSQRQHFWSRGSGDNGSAFSGMDGRTTIQEGWIGRWDAADDWEFIAVFPRPLRRALQDHGFDVEATLRVWRERGWIKVDQDGKRLTRSVRIDGANAGVVYFPRAVIEQLSADEEI